jgi:cell division protein FtsW
MLLTAALCLLAFGAVMVYSASSPLGVLGGHGGTGTSEFVRYLIFAALGLAAMQILARRGLALLSPKIVALLLAAAFALTLLVLVPGFGVRLNGARRWFSAGPIQFQPSELLKLALVLYAARYLADHPKRMRRSFREAVAPIALIVVPGLLLVVVEPDLGTALVIAFAIAALLVAAGMPGRYLLALAGLAGAAVFILVLARPYEQARLTSFLHPWAASCKAGPCYQAVQGQIALGSGGLWGVGLGHSVQKIFYLPEAQTDFILAVIGEELGVLGICGVVFLYGMIAYAGLRTARRARSLYSALIAVGVTSLIVSQALLNVFAVLGMAPLTGVPLPFVSYGSSSLIVMLCAMGLLLNVASGATAHVRAVPTARPRSRDARAPQAARWDRERSREQDRDRRRRDRGARGAGARGGRGATG